MHTHPGHAHHTDRHKHRNSPTLHSLSFSWRCPAATLRCREQTRNHGLAGECVDDLGWSCVLGSSLFCGTLTRLRVLVGTRWCGNKMVLGRQDGADVEQGSSKEGRLDLWHDDARVERCFGHKRSPRSACCPSVCVCDWFRPHHSCACFGPPSTLLPFQRSWHHGVVRNDSSISHFQLRPRGDSLGERARQRNR